MGDNTLIQGLLPFENVDNDGVNDDLDVDVFSGPGFPEEDKQPAISSIFNSGVNLVFEGKANNEKKIVKVACAINMGLNDGVEDQATGIIIAQQRNDNLSMILFGALEEEFNSQGIDTTQINYELFLTTIFAMAQMEMRSVFGLEIVFESQKEIERWTEILEPLLLNVEYTKEASIQSRYKDEENIGPKLRFKNIGALYRFAKIKLGEHNEQLKSLMKSPVIS